MLTTTRSNKRQTMDDDGLQYVMADFRAPPGPGSFAELQQYLDWAYAVIVSKDSPGGEDRLQRLKFLAKHMKVNTRIVYAGKLSEGTGAFHLNRKFNKTAAGDC